MTSTASAEEAQLILADAKQDPAATNEDILRLGQTLKGRADLMRLNGQLTEAGPVFDRAVTLLERAHADDAKNAEIRNELAVAVELRGWNHRDLGDAAKAEADYRRSLDLLDKLVAEFPTVPRHRFAMAKACNSLGILEQEQGRLDEAEAHLRRQIPLADRLSQDFPEQPDYRRVLARALNVFGGVLRLRGDLAEAKPTLQRAVELDTAILAKSPDDVLIRHQLATAHKHLGEILRQQGRPKAAVEELRKARALYQALISKDPEKPSYSSELAANLDTLGLSLHDAGQPGADEEFRAAIAIYERLIDAHPQQAELRTWLANCLQNQGSVLAEEGKSDQAEATYQRALTLLETRDAKVQTPDVLRKQSEILSQLGLLHRDGAEDAFRRSVAISEKLLAGKAGTATDRYNQAVAQNNLADYLSPEPWPPLAIAGNQDAGRPAVRPERLPDAGRYFAQSVANFEKLVADVPKSMDFRQVFGIVLVGRAGWFDRTGKLADARAALVAAIEQQRQAVALSNNAPVCRLKLAEHLIRLADANRKLGAYDEAARLALEVTRTVPSDNRPEACYDSARALARLIAQADADNKLHQADRERLARTYLGRTALLLREAIDSGPKLAEQIKADPDIKILQTRPQFQTIMNTLVNVGQ